MFTIHKTPHARWLYGRVCAVPVYSRCSVHALGWLTEDSALVSTSLLILREILGMRQCFWPAGLRALPTAPALSA